MNRDKNWKMTADATADDMTRRPVQTQKNYAMYSNAEL